VGTSKLLVAVTGSRLIFAAAFAAAALAGEHAPLLPLAVLVELSDMADGIVARRTGTSSDVGTVYDGMADLIARMTEFIALAAIGAIEFFPVLVFLWREALVIAAQRIAHETGTRAGYGRVSGKLKGISQGACILWLAAAQTAPSISVAMGRWVSPFFVWLAVITTVLSGFDYLFAHRGALRASVASHGTSIR
jgi:CDP-diacylglycerol--glycerol-3-phosphate 3-phosphatidyltransferase